MNVASVLYHFHFLWQFMHDTSPLSLRSAARYREAFSRIPHDLSSN
jgi:hypothetical protein